METYANQAFIQPVNDIILLRFAPLKKGNVLETERLLYYALKRVLASGH